MRRFLIACLVMLQMALGARAEEIEKIYDGGVRIITVTDTLLLLTQNMKTKPSYRLLKVRMDIPVGYPALQKYLSWVVFRANEKSFYKMYIDTYIKGNPYTPVDKSVLDKNDLITVESITLKLTDCRRDKYLSFSYEYKALNSDKATSFLSDDAAIFNFNKLDSANVTRESFVLFDIERDKVMGYNDIFEKPSFDISPQFKIFSGILYAKRENVYTHDPLYELKPYLTEHFKSLIDWDKVEKMRPKTDKRLAALKQLDEERQKQLDEERQKQLAIRERQKQLAMEKQQEQLDEGRQKQLAMKKQQLAMLEKKRPMHLTSSHKLPLEVKWEYQESASEKNVLYMYMWNDTCYVSGLNKDINKLTEADLVQIEQHDPDFLKDIRLARESIAYGVNAFNMKYCDSYLPIKEIPVDSAMISTERFFQQEFLYFIDVDGKLRMPVYLHPSTGELDRYMVEYCRKRKWEPSTYKGKPVRSYGITSLRDMF